MKILFLLLLSIKLGAQPSSYPFQAGPPVPVTVASATLVGNVGNQTYFYYIIARYPIGNAVRSVPFPIVIAPATLTVTNYVRISWNAVNGATGYDVLRLTGAGGGSFPPSGTCLNCLIVSNSNTTTYNDQSNATLGNYTVTQAPGATATLYLDNVSKSVPTIFFDSPGSETFALTSRMGFDANAARITIPNRQGASLPLTCDNGETFFLNTTFLPYICGPANIWSTMGGGAGGITQIFGDLSAIGPGVALGTLANSGVTPGTCDTSVNTCTIIVDVKGRVTTLTTGGPASLGICTFSITSPTVITFAVGSSGTTPCNLGVGNKSYAFTTPITFTIGANGGTGYLYFSSAGVVTLGYGGGTFAGGNVVAAGAGSAATFGVTSTPVDAYPLATYTAAAGIWTAQTNTKSEGSAMIKFVAGANVTLTQANDQLQIDATSSGLSVTTSGEGFFCIPSCADSVTAANVWASKVPRYYQFVLPYTQKVTNIALYIQTPPGSGCAGANPCGIAAAFYDSTCTKVAGSDITTLTGAAGVATLFTLPAPVTLPPGVYHLGAATDSAVMAAYSAVDGTVFGSLVNLTGNGGLRFFTGATSATGDNGGLTMPASCGAKTAIPSPFEEWVVTP